MGVYGIHFLYPPKIIFSFNLFSVGLTESLKACFRLADFFCRLSTLLPSGQLPLFDAPISTLTQKPLLDCQSCVPWRQLLKFAS